MKNLLFFFTIIILFSFLSCTNSGSGAVTPVENRDANGALLSRGQNINGVKTGTWVEYNPDKGLPVKISTWLNGNLDGAYLEFNNRGQIELSQNYRNNQLHGPYAKFKFGKTIESVNYTDGKQDGVYRSYFNNTDKLQKEVEYKNGIQHGAFRQYNEEGKVVLEYQYDNGKVVSGGMTEQN